MRRCENLIEVSKILRVPSRKVSHIGLKKLVQTLLRPRLRSCFRDK